MDMSNGSSDLPSDQRMISAPIAKLDPRCLLSMSAIRRRAGGGRRHAHHDGGPEHRPAALSHSRAARSPPPPSTVVAGRNRAQLANTSHLPSEVQGQVTYAPPRRVLCPRVYPTEFRDKPCARCLARIDNRSARSEQKAHRVLPQNNQPRTMPAEWRRLQRPASCGRRRVRRAPTAAFVPPGSNTMERSRTAHGFDAATIAPCVNQPRRRRLRPTSRGLLPGGVDLLDWAVRGFRSVGCRSDPSV